jgi:hypothetical protein
MRKLTHADLWKLEDYARERTAFRTAVIAHKKRRGVRLGEHVTLLFEDRMTMQYQVQEMLRIERIFEPAAIADELDAYNALIPDGGNLKATMLIEYPDPEVRKRELARLRGIEDSVALRVGTRVPVAAIADEDMERSNDDKTSAVHFLRFELDPGQVEALRAGAALAFLVSHPQYAAEAVVPPETRAALLADFD